MNTINVTSAPKTATFQMRINPEVKQRVEDIYARQGLSFTDAVNIFIQQSLNVEGLPFVVTPKSKAAKKLIFRKAGAGTGVMGDRMIRIVFEGAASSEPYIASLILECHVSVNIMYADTRDVGGKTFGQMILQLPEDHLQQDKIIFYLRSKGLRVEEVSSDGH